LEEEAARKKVSVNTLVNQLLANYIDVGRHRQRLGTISLSASAFKLIISTETDDEVIKAAQVAGKSIPRAYAASKWGHESVANILAFIRENASVTELYDYSDSPDNPKVITLTHSYGRKWSLFLSNFFISAFEDAGQRVQSEVSDQAVILKLQ